MKSLLLNIVFGLLLMVGIPAQGQVLAAFMKEVEATWGVCSGSYFGDIGGKDSGIDGVQAVFDNLDIDLWQVRGGISGGVRVFPMKDLGLSLQLTPMLLSGNDLRSNYASRGYSFQTWLLEGSLQGEYYLANRTTQFAPFGLIGISGMLYRFKNNTANQWSKVYPANTFLFGAGFRFPSTSRWSHTIDFVFHFAGTDFLDGYKSSRKKNDVFFTIGYKMNLRQYTQWYYDNRGLVR